MKNYILINPILLKEQEESDLPPDEKKKAEEELEQVTKELDDASNTTDRENPKYRTRAERKVLATKEANLKAKLGIPPDQSARDYLDDLEKKARDAAQAAEKAVEQPKIFVRKKAFLARASSGLNEEQKEYVREVINTEEELDFYEEKYDFGREYKGVMPREEFDKILAIEKPDDFKKEKEEIKKKYKVKAPPKKTYTWADFFDALFEDTGTFWDATKMLFMGKDKLNDFYRKFQAEEVDPETGELTFKTEKDKQEADDLHSVIELVTDAVAGLYGTANGYFMGKESAMETARLGGMEKKRRVLNLFGLVGKERLQLKRGPFRKAGRALFEIAATFIAPQALLSGKAVGFATGLAANWSTRKARYTNLVTARTELKEVRAKLVNLRKSGKTAEERAKLTATIQALEADKNKLEQSIKNLEDAAKEAEDALRDSPKPNEFNKKANDAAKKASESTKMTIIDAIDIGDGNYVPREELGDAAEELKLRMKAIDGKVPDTPTTNKYFRRLQTLFLPGKQGGRKLLPPKTPDKLDEQKSLNLNTSSLDSELNDMVEAALAAQDQIVRDEIESALMENYLFESITLDLSKALIKEMKEAIKDINQISTSTTAEPEDQTPVSEGKIKITKSKLIDFISEQVKDQTQTVDITKDQLVALVAEEAFKQINRKK
jgi:hypothetical protein